MKITRIATTAQCRERWLLEFYSAEKQTTVRLRFKSKDAAEKFYKETKKLRARGFPAALAQASPVLLADITAALSLIAGQGVRLVEAVEFFLKGRKDLAALRPMTGSEALVEEFLAAKRAEGCRTMTVKSHLNALAAIRTRSPKPIEMLTGSQLFDLLAAAKVSNVSKNNWRRHARVFYKWLKARGYRLDDAGAGVATFKQETKDPCIYTADESERLMRAAAATHPRFVRAYALGLFCGIRPQGIARLTEADILLDDKLVRVGWEQDKTGQKYFAEMPENLVAWLARFNTDQVLAVTKHCHTGILAAAGLRGGHDILRHTFASHHLAAHQSIEKTAHALNHRGAEMLFRHYRAAVKPAEGVRFFQIRPK